MFGLLKKLGSPDFGREVIKASYRKHYKIAEKQGVEPVSGGLFGALGSRYQITRKLKPEPMLWVEVVPFIMAGQHDGLEHLASYLICQEVPSFDTQELVTALNNIISSPAKTNEAKDAYGLLVSALPYLEGSGILWMGWLNEPTAKQLMADSIAAQDKTS